VNRDPYLRRPAEKACDLLPGDVACYADVDGDPIDRMAYTVVAVTRDHTWALAWPGDGRPLRLVCFFHHDLIRPREAP